MRHWIKPSLSLLGLLLAASPASADHATDWELNAGGGLITGESGYSHTLVGSPIAGLSWGGSLALRAGMLFRNQETTVSYATRSIHASPSSSPEVELAIDPPSETSAYAVEESLPEGVTPEEVSDAGSWDTVNRKLKWGPFFDDQARSLTFEATGDSGTYSLTGVVSFDGQSYPVLGDSSLTIAVNPAGECSTDAVIIIGTNFAAASHSIASEQAIATEGTVTLAAGAEVTLQAPTISFGTGFRVTSGALLRAQIGPTSCDTPALAHQEANPLATPEASASAGSGGSEPMAPRLFSDASELPDWIESLLSRLGVDLQRAEDILADNDYLWLVFATIQGIGPTDQNGYRDVYRLDLFTEALTLLSRTPQGDAGNGPSRYPAADASGELVVFQSDADDLVEGDANAVTDIFLHDVPFGETIRVTAAAVAASEHPALDALGEDLLYDQRNADGRREVLIDGLWDGAVPESVSLSEDDAGVLLDNHHPAISADGRYLAYLEAAADTAEPMCQVHVYDRDTGRYRRAPCPSELAADSESARSYFSADDSGVWWYLPGMEAPVIVPNPLMDGQAVTTP